MSSNDTSTRSCGCRSSHFVNRLYFSTDLLRSSWLFRWTTIPLQPIESHMIDDAQVQRATPRPSDSLSLAGQYEGRGRAEFSNPKGSIEGEVRASFDELGNLEIVMDVDKVDSPERKLVFGLDEFLSGEVPVLNGSRYSMDMNLEFKNPCDSLEVSTPEGKLRAKGKILY